ncbi:hypothetical protein DTO271G3_5594 [Paecilomyces variotii]|nr:hypothetical protein DTO271G3_5594 [Paecilomyces variotii]
MQREIVSQTIKIDQLLTGRLGTYRIARKLHPRIWAAAPLNQSTGPVVIKTAPKLRLENERTVLSHLRNQLYIRQLVDEIPESESNPAGLVLKRLDDNLLEAADVKRLKRGEVRLIARDILKGLKALHEAGWVHTDIKPDNILVNYGKGLLRFSSVQLGDCGHACRDTPIGSTDPYHGPRNRHTIGAALYRSPEAMLNLPWDTSTDIWSFGVTITTLLRGPEHHIFAPSFNISPSDETYPFHVLIKQIKEFGAFPSSYSTDPVDAERMSVMNYIQNHMLRIKLAEAWDPVVEEDEESELGVTREDREFIGKILKMDPRERPTARELLQDRWLGPENEE